MNFLLPLTTLFAASLASAFAQPAAPSLSRFSLRPELLSLTNCLARPGAVPLQLNSSNSSLEILDWSTAAVASSQPGEFIVRFVAPTPVGSVIAYDPGEVAFLSSNSWRKLDPGSDAGRRLQFLPLPPGAVVDAIRFVIPAVAQPAARGGPPLFKATLPFATFIPIRVVNIATDASVTVSSTAPGSQPASLVDGFIDERRNFSTSRHPEPLSPSSSEWVMLSWSAPRSVRGLLFLRGREDTGFGEGIVEVFTNDEDPRASKGTNGWRAIVGRSALPGTFRGNQFFVSLDPLEVRGLRISSTGGVDRLSCGEIAVLPDLGAAPPASASARVEVKPITASKVATNRILIDGRDDDWPGERAGSFALAFDDELLYVLYRATGEAARFENKGTNVQELFHTGDAIDVMLQTRPGLNPGRPAAGRGDVRLVFSVFEGKPVCVLYEFHSDDLLLVPARFASGNRATVCDKVSLLGTARVATAREAGALTLEASVPLSALHLRPGALKETRGDLGRIFSAPGGATAAKRSRWTGQTTALVGDLAAEAELLPANWGVLRFGGQ